ncbi:hypothetical protein GCM10010195_48500 [Kitasatospora griseola]|nr:hypothetical protein GCM10010195_48500 [Kitasatospora griseola]
MGVPVRTKRWKYGLGPGGAAPPGPGRPVGQQLCESQEETLMASWSIGLPSTVTIFWSSRTFDMRSSSRFVSSAPTGRPVRWTHHINGRSETAPRPLRSLFRQCPVADSAP